MDGQNQNTGNTDSNAVCMNYVISILHAFTSHPHNGFTLRDLMNVLSRFKRFIFF